MAKPKLDLKNPIVAGVIKVAMEKAAEADRLAASKDDAVRPVYAANKLGKVEHVGSCVLLRIKDAFFALSASHVFDQVGDYVLLFGHGDLLHPLAGDRFSSPRGPSGTHQDDPIDASAYHITADIPDSVAASFLTLQDLDIFAADRSREFYVATGFRVSKSKSTNKGHSTRLERYPSNEVNQERYEHLKLSREMHLVLAAEDQVLIGGQWQTSPSIRGFSGGAMFRISGLSPLPSASADNLVKVKLAAILIARCKRNDRFDSAMVGTRLGVYFQMIDRYLPDLKIEELLTAERATLA